MNVLSPTTALVRPHARAGVEITIRPRGFRRAGAFALMRGRELKSCRALLFSRRPSFALMRGRELKFHKELR